MMRIFLNMWCLLMNRINPLSFFPVCVFFLLILSACTTTGISYSYSYGKIVYRIDFSHSDDSKMRECNIARCLHLAKTQPLLFYDPTEPTFLSYNIYPAFKHIRLSRTIEAEGQFLIRDGFDAPFAGCNKSLNDAHSLIWMQYGRAMARYNNLVRVDLSIFPSDRCMFVVYKWYERRDAQGKNVIYDTSVSFIGEKRPEQVTINKCNQEIVHRLEMGGFSVNKIIRWNQDDSILIMADKHGGDQNLAREYCITFEDDKHNVPSKNELRTMLNQEFFFTTALSINSKTLGYNFFWMLDRFHDVLFIYHIQDKKLRIINQYKDNAINYQIVERILKNNGYTVKDMTEKTYKPTFDDTEWWPDTKGIGNPYDSYSVPFITKRFFSQVYTHLYKEISP